MMAKGSGGARPQGRIVAGGRGSREWLAQRAAAREEYGKLNTQIHDAQGRLNSAEVEVNGLTRDLAGARSYDKPVIHSLLMKATTKRDTAASELKALLAKRSALRPVAWPR
jgi:hypothetical protein